MDCERLKRRRIVNNDISGENLRSRGIVVNEDRISELPDNLLEQILCLLPAKDVTATSILSKRYRSLWKMVPKLNFESRKRNVKTFIKNVGRFLLSHQAPILESLSLHVYHRCGPYGVVEIGKCIGIALTRHMRELDLMVPYTEPVKFPSSLFVSNTLETLKLDCFFIVDISSTVCMKSLRTLHLSSAVRYKDQESVSNLLSGCPNLENLLVHRPFYSEVIVKFSIMLPSLKTLSIRDSVDEQKNGGYVINTPCLKFLNIERLNDSSNFCLTENLSELVEANISNLTDIPNYNILGSFKSVKRLSLGLSRWEVAYPTGIIFSQLLYLEIDTQRVIWWEPWNLIMHILDSSPKLQVLKLTDESVCLYENIRSGGKLNQPKYVPECLLFHLKTFVWKRYDWESEEEKEVATYILKNAKHLKKATFSPRSVQSKKQKKLKERCKLLKELDAMARASDSCQITVSE